MVFLINKPETLMGCGVLIHLPNYEYLKTKGTFDIILFGCQGETKTPPCVEFDSLWYIQAVLVAWC